LKKYGFGWLYRDFWHFRILLTDNCTCTKYIYNILEKQMFQKIITKLIRIYKLYYFVGHNIWFFESLSGDVYSIQHYMIKFVGDLRQVGDFLWILWVSATNKTDRHDITEILLKVTLNTITLTQSNVMTDKIV
jgi:hypothetical protein